MDLVSVIIPYYKKKDFIIETVESVLNQSYSKIEILIIYDDEDKNDLFFLKRKFQHEVKIKIYENDKNIGAGLSRNKGINFSEGKYIGFIDADDLWDKDKVFTQISYMKEFNLNISHTSYKIIDENNQIKSSRIAREFNNYKDLLKSCDIGLSTVMLDKKIISEKKKFPNLKTKEDFVLWLKILQSGITIGALKKDLSYWRKTKNSLSSSIIQKLFDGYKVYRKYMGYNQFKSFYLLMCLSVNYLKK